MSGAPRTPSAAHRWSAPVVAALAVVGCQEVPRTTWLDVKVAYRADVVIDQLRFEVLDGAQSLVAASRPDPPAGVLPSEQGVVILLPDAVAGHHLTVLVTGLRESTEVAHAVSDFTPTLGDGVTRTVALGMKAEEPPASITVTPEAPTASAGTTVRLYAAGHFQDGSTRSLTDAMVHWESASPLVASVDATGLVTAQQVGGATIYAIANVGDARGSTDVTVTSSMLEFLSLSPENYTFSLLATQQFVLTGHLADHRTEDRTNDAHWKSSNPVVATIGDNANDKGLATGRLMGMTTITATLDGVPPISTTLRVK